jgi:hypothetical protein
MLAKVAYLLVFSGNTSQGNPIGGELNSAGNQFTAPASAVGYLYQARLALLLCIPHVNSGAEVEVSIERLDDVSFEKDGTAFELLQTKHHINRIGSLSNASPDLWKTLRIWAQAAKDDPSLPSRTKLALVTTAAAPAESAAALLRPPCVYPAGGEARSKICKRDSDQSRADFVKRSAGAFVRDLPRASGCVIFRNCMQPRSIGPRPQISLSPVIRKQLDGIVEPAYRKFADALELEIAFDEIGKRMRQQHILPHLLGERLQA